MKNVYMETLLDYVSKLKYDDPEPFPEEYEFVKFLHLSNPHIWRQLINHKKNEVFIFEAFLHWCYRWKQFGMPNFQPTHGLTNSLLLTECINLNLSDVKFPFGSLLITFPEPNDTFCGYRWMAVHKWKILNEKQQYIPSLYFQLSHPDGQKNPEIRFLRSFYTENDSLEDWIENSEPHEDSQIIPEHEKNLMKLTTRIAINLSLYVTNLEPGIGGKNKQSKKKNNTKNRPTTFIIGNEIKLPENLKKIANNFASTDKALWRINSRFIVRGHWRNQSCGEKNVQRKRIWIQPHWKGPLIDGQAFTKLYSVDNLRENSI